MSITSPRRMYARIAEVSVEKYIASTVSSEKDLLAVEEPLEIRVKYYEDNKPATSVLSLTMRTPGDDEALALGFLFAECIISSKEDVLLIEEGTIVGRDKLFAATLSIELHPHVAFDPQLLQRHFFSTSSCGVCGRLTLNNLPAPEENLSPELRQDQQVNPEIFFQLPGLINTAQTLFHHTGGIHAAALFDQTGQFIHLSEDVGRHNAMDKLIGYTLAENITPSLSNHIVLFSGRVSYELVQKAVVAGIPIIAAIGAPSSLAVEIADTYGITLIGFLRGNRFNVYAGGKRIFQVKNQK